MVVDTSFQSQPEDHMEDVVTLAVGEYAEDIHQYLREAEVSCCEKLIVSVVGCNIAEIQGCH